jgi:uncharacterized protein YecT (DUF1311 family)
MFAAQVRAISRGLRTDDARTTFGAGERRWLQYRRQSCSAEASHLAGGSAHSVALLSCDLRRNTSHLADLATMRKALAQR